LDLKLRNKTALVTGASAGIGRGIAETFGREGVHVAMTARRMDRLADVAREIVRSGGREPVVIVEDLLSEGAPRRIAEAALKGLGTVDAGGSRPFKIGADEAQWQEAMTLNFTRPRQLAHELLGQMVARNWGRIICITGNSEPAGVNGAFSAKAGMHAWSKGLSREVGRHAITINSVAPGRILSEQIVENSTEEQRRRFAEREIPIGRYGEPGDIAALVAFLASPLAGYITGAVIPVDGGLRKYQF
jgi:3-oxoacyl-[acyl-carrier protein] reductase